MQQLFGLVDPPVGADVRHGVQDSLHGVGDDADERFPATASDKENEVHGRPDARLVVPSTGSQYQVGPSQASPPSSSPTTWWSGNARR